MNESKQRDPSDELENLLDLLGPILAHIASLAPAEVVDQAQAGRLEADLERTFPHGGEQIQGLGTLLERGVREGWLANRGGGDASFSRVSKPCPRTHALSVDVVSMVGSGLDHTHPMGEITIGFPARMEGSPSCRFESRAPAWVFLPPNSRHVPTVVGERMNLIYFLPDGAVEWHRG